MANVYVRSGAGGAGTGADWTNAYTTLAAACTAKAAGDVFYVAADHAETQASAMTITAPGTVSNPNRILCVTHTGTVPPVSVDLRTTATISTTGANAISINGFFYCYGIIFQTNSAGAGGGGAINLTNTTGNQQRYDACVFRPLSSAAKIIASGANGGLYLNNCSMKFANVGDNISLGRGRFMWTNSASAIDAAGFLPTTLFNVIPGPAHLTLEGVDLSALTPGKTIFAAQGVPADIVLKDCKLPASITISASQTLGLAQGDVTLIRCDSAVNYRAERHNYAGTQTTETTVVRTGGATDGTQAVAFKVVTTANSRWSDAFTCLPLSIWNDTSGSSVTATVYGTWATGSAVPNKEDIWIDVEYLGASGDPQGSFISSGNADILATAANSSDGSTWGGTPAGGGTPTPFKMAVTFTPQMKGPLTVYVRCARASTNAFYIDPKVVLS